MSIVPKDEQAALVRIKRNTEAAWDYFKPNYDRFNDFRRFVFKSSLSTQDIQVLDTLKKPKLEFNILEAYISRLRGEFATQEPSILVSSEDGESASPELISILEGHLRHILYEANQNSFEYNCYTDLLSGGFSAAKVFTEYANPMSFDQVIKWVRVFDPTMVGFDPLAKDDDKGDGRFCFELFPRSKEAFEKEYPDVDLSQMKFLAAQGGFSWSYENVKEEIVIIADYYERKEKRTKIVKLANGVVVTKKRYDEFLKEWESRGMFAQPPAIVEERYTMLSVICRYKVIETQVLEYEETDYDFLPFTYIDGNSILIRESNNGTLQQYCRPYVYHARGVQQLKNFAGQTLANELENMIMHKWKVAKESIPPQYKEAYLNPQLASTLVYNAFKNDDPNVPLPAPMEIQRVPTPPEVTNTFMITDSITQNVLGSFDSAARQATTSDISGKAVIESATLTNAASMPYVVGFLKGLNSLCQKTLTLIPKYLKGERNLPVMGIDRKRKYEKVNGQSGINLNYDPHSMKVKVEPGVNFALQKSRALTQIIGLMQASPLFGQFMNEKGLSVLLDNLEIRGIDQLKELSEEWQQEMQQMKQQAANQPNPEMIKAQMMQQKMQSDAQKNQTDAMLKSQQLQIDKEKNATEVAKVIAGMQESRMSAGIQMEKANAEKFSKAVDLALETSKHHHDVVDKHFHREMKVQDMKHKHAQGMRHES